ncbi:MAG: type II toxin-antitoxin system RelE/ParE family toxin [Desulfobacteraceae bacterium]|jgi:plasmid stabilization system protein ParE
MKFNFHPDALNEYSEAAHYYASVSPSLAISFVTQIEDGINQILMYPEAWTEIEEDVRRYLTKQFPFGIYYTIESNDSILIQAIMHLRRLACPGQGTI